MKKFSIFVALIALCEFVPDFGVADDLVDKVFGDYHRDGPVMKPAPKEAPPDEPEIPAPKPAEKPAGGPPYRRKDAIDPNFVTVPPAWVRARFSDDTEDMSESDVEWLISELKDVPSGEIAKLIGKQVSELVGTMVEQRTILRAIFKPRVTGFDSYNEQVEKWQSAANGFISLNEKRDKDLRDSRYDMLVSTSDLENSTDIVARQVLQSRIDAEKDTQREIKAAQDKDKAALKWCKKWIPQTEKFLKQK